MMDDILVFAKVTQDCRTKYLEDIAEEDLPSLKRIAERCNIYDAKLFYEMTSSVPLPQRKAYSFEMLYSMLGSISLPTVRSVPGSDGIEETNGMVLSLLDPSRKQRQDVIAHLRKIGFFEKDIVKKIIEFSEK
jgi:hypothetical protein